MLAPTTVRPNTLFKIAATAIRMEYETLTITAVVKRTSYDGKTTESICNGEHTFVRPGSFDITMQVRWVWEVYIYNYVGNKFHGQMKLNHKQKTKKQELRLYFALDNRPKSFGIKSDK